ncbi:hypothetical protein KO465_02975 [Candidatus Micrarchaeota archaeon]|nr:hypothetical protein [Candidatus Micrarchaeota archaeon]
MDKESLELGIGFLLPESQKMGYQTYSELKKLMKTKTELNPFVAFPMFDSFTSKIAKEIGKDKTDYKVINGYITGEGLLNIDGSKIIQKMIKETTKLDINISFPIPPTNNSYVLCISKILLNYKNDLVRSAKGLDNKKIIYDWSINEYKLNVGEVDNLESLIIYKENDLVLAHNNLIFAEANQDQIESINENIRMVCSKFLKMIE